jgi:hypothetical protein
MPLSGSWTGFPSDLLGMTVEVHVTSEGAASPESSVSRGSDATVNPTVGLHS